MSRKLIVHLWEGEDLPGFSKNVFDAEDVLRLWRGARRTVSDLEFIVFADDDYLPALVAIEDVSREERDALAETMRVLRYRGHGIGGWSNRMETFEPGRIHLARGERAVMMDLDTVLIRDLNWLWEWDLAPIGMPVDPYDKAVPCSGVVTFNALGANVAWDEYRRAKARRPFPYLIFNRPSEMMLLRRIWLDQNWPFLEDGMEKLRSLKGSGLQDGGPIPPGTDLVYLHGKPKLRDLPPEHLVRQLWEKI